MGKKPELQKNTWFFCKHCKKNVVGYLTGIRWDFIFPKIVYEYFCDICKRFTYQEFDK